MENEIWKDVVGYEGLYQVSNIGRVKSIRKRKPTKANQSDRKCVIMQPYSGAARYLGVTLRKDGKGKTHTVHRLVARAFLPNPFGFPCVNHKDEDCFNNHVDNLEWCTQEYNANHGNAILKRSISNSKHAPYYGKTVCAYTKDNEFVGSYPSIGEAADALDLKATTARAIRYYVNRCCLGMQETAYGFKWRYLTEKDITI